MYAWYLSERIIPIHGCKSMGMLMRGIDHVVLGLVLNVTICCNIFVVYRLEKNVMTNVLRLRQSDAFPPLDLDIFCRSICKRLNYRSN